MSENNEAEEVKLRQARLWSKGSQGSNQKVWNNRILRKYIVTGCLGFKIKSTKQQDACRQEYTKHKVLWSIHQVSFLIREDIFFPSPGMCIPAH